MPAMSVAVAATGSDTSVPSSVTPPTMSGAASATTTASSLPALRPQLPLPVSPRGAHLKTVPSSRNVAHNNNSNSAADVERKRRFVRRVPILQQLLKEQHCTEDQLTSALRLASYADGEYIYCQGHAEKDVYFVEDGKVLITQRRQPGAGAGAGASPLAAIVGALSTGVVSPPVRRRSLQEADLEVQVHTHHELEYFGELALLQRQPTRKSNAIASGAVACVVLLERDFEVLLQPLHALMLYRHLLRAHGVLEKDRLFKEWAPAQRQFLIDRCHLQAFADGDEICRQGETDDTYYVLVEGEADVLIEEATLLSILSDAAAVSANSSTRSLPLTSEPMTTVVAHKSIFQGFGEMGLLDKPRTASVVAVGGTPVLCIVITRKLYVTAAQLLSGSSSSIDADAEALLATTLMEEWKLVINARNLHLSNPQVAHYLVTFIKQFKAAYNQKFAGKTLYLDLFRRLHQEPALADEFAFVAVRITWDSPSSSLGIIRSETRRVLSKPTDARTAEEVSFIGRLIETTAFLGKFDVPGPHVTRAKLARSLARVVAFVNIPKDAYLFRQGKIESRAFLILRGKINIVNEDVTGHGTAIKHHEVIATLSAGDSFGELSLVTRLQRSATTMAACDTDLLVLDRDHLQLVQAALPGVSVQQLMVQRAEFLARLSFFRGSDFGQCIRVAHDVQEVAYDARHLFLQESAHQRTLYIVKSGEIGVFMKLHVPSASPTTAAGSVAVVPLSPRTSDKAAVPLPSSSSTTPASSAKAALVRVATIGAQEFFGIAIASANVGSVAGNVAGTAVPPSSSSFSSVSPSPIASLLHATSEYVDLGAAVYMSTTRVEMLELSERGWRRLSPQSLAIIRSALRERHRWNAAAAQKQLQRAALASVGTGSGTATGTSAAAVYYQLDRPWQPLALYGVGSGPTGESSHLAAPTSGGRPHSLLARHVHDKQTFASPFAKMFTTSESAAAATGVTGVTTATVMPNTKTSERRASVSTASTASSSVGGVASAWGWRSPFDSTPSPSKTTTTSSSSTNHYTPSRELSPLVSFTATAATATTGPTSLGLTTLLPRPPRAAGSGPTMALAHLTLSPTAPASVAPLSSSLRDSDTATAATHATSMWKSRSPLARRTEYHAP